MCMTDSSKTAQFMRSFETSQEWTSVVLVIVKGVVISAVGLGSNPGKTILNGDRDTAIQVQT